MSIIAHQLKSLPNNPGIYLFYNSKKELLYVGKATSLKSRVKSYFTSLLSFPPRIAVRGKLQRESSFKTSGSPIRSGMTIKKMARPIEEMIHEVTNIKTIQTDSVLEAIILEANYIKKFQPKYNVDLKDDKSWNYLYLTDEPFPKLKTIRQHKMNKINSLKNNWKLEIRNWKFLFGPFPNLNTREALKILHKLFYISRCEPLTPSLLRGTPPYKGGDAKPCFDYQLGSCLGVCTGEISVKEYREKVIRPLTEFLKGNKKRLVSNLNKQMRSSAKEQNFEEAARLRNQIQSLKKIQDVTLLNKEFYSQLYVIPAQAGIQKNNFWIPGQARNDKKELRLEAYDISNLGPTGKVGSMVVFDERGPVKSEYRKFKIKTVAGQSDVDCLKEIISRRLKNNWPLPDLILVDGGVPQVNAIKNVLKNVGAYCHTPAQNNTPPADIPVIGIAKGQTRKKNEFIIPAEINQTKKEWISRHHSLLIRARDEAHRFAIQYQRKLSSAF